jgi:hypothetical protein
MYSNSVQQFQGAQPGASGSRKLRNTNTLSGTDLTPSRQSYIINTSAPAQPKNNNLLTKYFSESNNGVADK